MYAIRSYYGTEPMEPILIEWLNLVARWIHVMAAIMWIGAGCAVP